MKTFITKNWQRYLQKIIITTIEDKLIFVRELIKESYPRILLFGGISDVWGLSQGYEPIAVLVQSGFQMWYMK